MTPARDQTVAAARSGQGKTSSTFKAFLRDLWIVIAIAVVVAILILVIEHAGRSEIGTKFVASLIFGILIGFPTALTLNWTAYRYADRFPRFVFVIYTVVVLITATAGCLAGAFVLKLTGIVSLGFYWREVRSSLPTCLVLTLVVGLSITSFETMRGRLQSATLELRTRQMEQERANKLMAEARLSSLESRIHPHFLFNTLNSIASLIPSDPKRAEDTVAKLAALLRFSLNANHSSLVPLAQELKIVRDFLEIESTRFGPRLRYQIAVPESLGTFKVPPLALQTLAENCIKHVAAQRTEGAEIQIRGASGNGRIRLEVIDDGPGFSLAAISPEHGLGNLSARLELLFGERSSLDVDRQNERTVVRISFPAEA